MNDTYLKLYKDERNSWEYINERCQNLNINNVILDKSIVNILYKNEIKKIKDLIIKGKENVKEIKKIGYGRLEIIKNSLEILEKHSNEFIFNILIDRKIEKTFDSKYDEYIIVEFNRCGNKAKTARNLKKKYKMKECAPERVRQKLNDYKKIYDELNEDFKIIDKIESNNDCFYGLEEINKCFSIHNTKLLYELLKLKYKNLYSKEYNIIFCNNKYKEEIFKNENNKVKYEVERYNRDVNLREKVLNNSNGKCKLCENNAPFYDTAGRPFLEVHHIIPLSKGGKDGIENMVALCPNCHRKMHILNNKNDIAKLLNQNL